MKKKLEICFFLTLFLISCGSKKEETKVENKTEVVQETKKEEKPAETPTSENSEKMTKTDESLKKEEEKMLEELKKIEFSMGYTKEPQPISEANKEMLKNATKKVFERVKNIAITDDNRFFIKSRVTDSKNIEKTAEEIVADRTDIALAISGAYKQNNLDYKFILIQEVDENDEILAQYVYYGDILEKMIEKKEYEEAISAEFKKKYGKN